MVINVANVGKIGDMKENIKDLSYEQIVWKLVDLATLQQDQCNDIMEVMEQQYDVVTKMKECMKIMVDEIEELKNK